MIVTGEFLDGPRTPPFAAAVIADAHAAGSRNAWRGGREGLHARGRRILRVCLLLAATSLILSACTSLTLLCGGALSCYYHAQNIKATADFSYQNVLDRFVARLADKPNHKAVAYARHRPRRSNASETWIWAGYHSAASAADARRGAVKRCIERALLLEISIDCRIYWVDGEFVDSATDT